MPLLNPTLVLIFSAGVLCFYIELPLLPNKKVPAYLYVHLCQLCKFSVVSPGFNFCVLIWSSMFSSLFSVCLVFRSFDACIVCSACITPVSRILL